MTEVITKVIKGGARVLDRVNTGFTIHSITSGRIFQLESLIVTNRSGDCEVNLWDGASGTHGQAFGYSGEPMLRVIVGAVKTEALGDDLLKPCELKFISSVVAFVTVSGTFIRYGGCEY